MPDLDPAHVEAVALVVDPAAFRHASHAWEAQRGVALLAAEAILTSTDPAVHEALLAALVRAGMLSLDQRVLRACGCRADTFALMCCEGGPTTTKRRYVTRWEDAP